MTPLGIITLTVLAALFAIGLAPSRQQWQHWRRRYARWSATSRLERAMRRDMTPRSRRFWE